MLPQLSASASATPPAWNAHPQPLCPQKPFYPSVRAQTLPLFWHFPVSPGKRMCSFSLVPTIRHGLSRAGRSRGTQEILRRYVSRAGVCSMWTHVTQWRGAIHWVGNTGIWPGILSQCGWGYVEDQERASGRSGNSELKIHLRHPDGYNLIQVILLLCHYFPFTFATPLEHRILKGLTFQVWVCSTWEMRSLNTWQLLLATDTGHTWCG